MTRAELPEQDVPAVAVDLQRPVRALTGRAGGSGAASPGPESDGPLQASGPLPDIRPRAVVDSAGAGMGFALA